MPASNPIEPAGGTNHVAVDYLSPKTLGGAIEIRNQDDGTGYGMLHTPSGSICFDKVDEYTPGAGVTIEGVKLQDGFVVGLRIGQEVQAYSPELTAIAANTDPADGGMLVGNGTTFVYETGTTLQTSLGLLLGTDVQAFDQGLQDIAGLAPTNNNFIVGNGTAWTLKDPTAARSSLGLGSIATQASSSVSITGGSISGITDLAVADGGTGASTAANARTNLGLGSIATQASSSVSITGGSISGITDLAVADGGTGASNASGARSNLGAAASGSNSDITALTNINTISDNSSITIQSTGAGSDITLNSDDDLILQADDNILLQRDGLQTITFNGTDFYSSGAVNLGQAANPFNGIQVTTVNRDGADLNITTTGGSTRNIVFGVNGTSFVRLSATGAENALRPHSAGGTNLGTNAVPWNGCSANVFNFTGNTSGNVGLSQGYLEIQVAGTTRKIQYYAV